MKQQDWQLDAKKHNLDIEEQELLAEIEETFPKSTLSSDDKKMFTQVARKTLRKRAINIRLSETDIRQIRSIALEE